jgi:hypothetical protein
LLDVNGIAVSRGKVIAIADPGVQRERCGDDRMATL